MANMTTSCIFFPTAELCQEARERFGEDLDFNRIIPMPPELDIASCSDTMPALYAYLASDEVMNSDGSLTGKVAELVDAIPKFMGDLVPPTDGVTPFRPFVQRLDALLDQANIEHPHQDVVEDEGNPLTTAITNGRIIYAYERMLVEHGLEEQLRNYGSGEEGGTKLYGLVAYGRAVAHNLINYHAESWYTWRFFHWDTKWPASNVYWDEDRVYLDTAWNPPCNIISHIAIELGTPLAAMWADEDFGQNVGYVFVGRDGYVLSQSDAELDALTSFCIASCLLDFRQELFRWDVENNMIVMSPGGDKDDELAQRFANMPLVDTSSLPAAIADHLKEIAAQQG